MKKNKKKFKSIVAVFLMLAILISGAFAYLTATDNKNNVFTIGDVDIELKETNWVADGNNWIHQNGDNDSILPGIPVDKDPYVSNTGVNSAWVFVTVGIPTGLETGENEVQSYGSDINIPVSAYAVQDIYDDSADSQAIFDRFFKETALKEFGEESTEAVVELFSMDNLDTTNWIQLGEAYNSADGHMYYTFAYKDMVKPDTDTTKLFETVTLRTDLVGTSAGLLPGVLIYTQENKYFSTEPVNQNKHFVYFDGKSPEYQGGFTKNTSYVQGDHYIDVDTGLKYEFDGEKWVLIGTVNPYASQQNDAKVPESILGEQVVDTREDPFEPDATPPVIGEEFEDEDYIYKYGYVYVDIDRLLGENAGLSGWLTKEECAEFATQDYDAVEEFARMDYTTLQWSVHVKDTTKTEYGVMKETIKGKPVDSIVFTYAGCSNLMIAPLISANARCVNGTFLDCTSLVNASAIPEGTLDMSSTFYGCTSLVNMPVLPSTLTVLSNTFYDCISLTETTTFPANLIIAQGVFEGCSSLATAPDMTQATKLASLNDLFRDCVNLTGDVKITTEALIDTGNYNSLSGIFSETEKPITFMYPDVEANNIVVNKVAFIPSNVTIMPY